MSTREVRKGLADRLRTIADLSQVYERVLGSHLEFPCALVDVESGEFQQVMGGTSTVKTYSVYVLAASGMPAQEAQDFLDDFVDRTGTNSVWGAVHGDGTLGGACERAWVRGWSEYGTHSLTAVGGVAQTYYGVRFDVEVWE